MSVKAVVAFACSTLDIQDNRGGLDTADRYKVQNTLEVPEVGYRDTVPLAPGMCTLMNIGDAEDMKEKVEEWSLMMTLEAGEVEEVLGFDYLDSPEMEAVH